MQKTILIVDDQDINRKIIAKILQSEYHVIQASDGIEALQILKKRSHEISAIILDIMMPKMDGYEVLKQIAQDPEFACIPVIVASNDNKSVREEKALQLGASDFVTKPYNPVILRKRLSNLVELYESNSNMLKIEHDMSIVENDSNDLYKSSTYSNDTLATSKRLMKRVKKMINDAKLDRMTGLVNRATLEQEIINYFELDSNAPAVFMILDVDNFKTVNDLYGHIEGDRLLREMSNRIKSLFREEDCVARMGGDELAVFVKGNVSEKMLIDRLNLMIDKLSFTFNKTQISCSVGVCVCPKYGNKYESIYYHGDVALLTAKRFGKNRYQIYGEGDELPEQIIYRNMDWLLDESSDAIYVCDANNYQIYYVNEVGCKMTGLTKEECMKMPCYKAIWNKSKPCSHCIHISSLGREYCEHEVQDKDTDQSYIIKGKIIDWGNREARIQFVQNNTAQHHSAKQMSQYLVALENQRNMLYSAIIDDDIICWEVDLSTNICTFSEKTVEKLHFPPSIENYPQCLIDNGTIQKVSENDFINMQNQIENGEPFIQKVITVKEKGEIIDKLVSYSAIYNDDGKIIHLLGTSQFLKNKE